MFREFTKNFNVLMYIFTFALLLNHQWRILYDQSMIIRGNIFLCIYSL